MPTATSAPTPGRSSTSGATSCYVTDNTDLLLLREGLADDRRPAWRRSSIGWPRSPPSTATCPAWASRISSRPSRRPSASGPASGPTTSPWTWPKSSIASPASRPCGSKGTTGTQASFLELFHGDHAKVRKLEELICRKIGFDAAYAVSGQTYSRKIDSQVLGVLSGVAQSAHKMATDSAALGPSQGSGRAVREGADRLVGDGLQAQPDAQRADLLAGPVRDEPANRAPRKPPRCNGWNARWTTAPTAG